MKENMKELIDNYKWQYLEWLNRVALNTKDREEINDIIEELLEIIDNQ